MGEKKAALRRLESSVDGLRAWIADTDAVFPIELACEVVDAFDTWKDAGSGTDPLQNSTGEDAPPAETGEDALAALDAAERAYLLSGGWTEVPPQNVMHEPTWTRAGRRYPTHRAQAISIQRSMGAAVNAGGENGDPQ